MNWRKLGAGQYKRDKWKITKDGKGWKVAYGRRTLAIAPKLTDAQFWADTHTPDGTPDYLDKIADAVIESGTYDGTIVELRRKRLDNSVVVIISDTLYQEGDEYAVIIARIGDNDAVPVE